MVTIHGYKNHVFIKKKKKKKKVSHMNAPESDARAQAFVWSCVRGAVRRGRLG